MRAKQKFKQKKQGWNEGVLEYYKPSYSYTYMLMTKRKKSGEFQEKLRDDERVQQQLEQEDHGLGRDQVYIRGSTNSEQELEPTYTRGIQSQI